MFQPKALDSRPASRNGVSQAPSLAPGGTYSSSYSVRRVACNCSRCRASCAACAWNPEGSKRVMQGMWTRIVSSGSRDRRGLIDNSAVSPCSIRIEQTRSKPNEVQDRQERFATSLSGTARHRQKLERGTAPRHALTRSCVQRHQESAPPSSSARLRGSRQQLAGPDQPPTSPRLQKRWSGSGRPPRPDCLGLAAKAVEALCRPKVKALGRQPAGSPARTTAWLEPSGRELTRQGERHSTTASNCSCTAGALVVTGRSCAGPAAERRQRMTEPKLGKPSRPAPAPSGPWELSRRRLGEMVDAAGRWLEANTGRGQQLRPCRPAGPACLAEHSKLARTPAPAAAKTPELGAETGRRTTSDQQDQQQLSWRWSRRRQGLKQEELDRSSGQAQDLAEALACSNAPAPG